MSSMNDLAFCASDFIEGALNLIGVVLFLVFVLPPFLVVFVPLLIFSSTVVFCGIGCYLAYVFCGVAWELVKNSYRWLWTGNSVPNAKPRAKRNTVYSFDGHIDTIDFVDFDRDRRQSGIVTPRKIAQPRSRSGSVHLKKSDSLHSLVGPGSDRDFEGTGGWANSNEDDEAMYMARSLGVQEPIYSPVLFHSSEPPARHQSPQGHRTPGSISRSGSISDSWKFTAGGVGSATPKASRSGTVTPESYFSLPMMQNKGVVALDRALPGPQPYHTHKKSNSSSSSLTHSTDGRNSNRDSGFFG